MDTDPIWIAILLFGSLLSWFVARLRFIDAYLEDSGMEPIDRRGLLLQDYLMRWTLWRQPPFHWRAFVTPAATPRTEKRRRAMVVTLLAIPSSVAAIMFLLTTPNLPLLVPLTLVITLIITPVTLTLWPES